MASNPKMEYQVFLCIFQNNSAMATLGLKEMGKFLWEGREKSRLYLSEYWLEISIFYNLYIFETHSKMSKISYSNVNTISEML